MSRWPTWLAWLTASHLQRLLREGMIRRALAFPVVLVGLTLALTLLVVGVLRGPSIVATDHPLPPAQARALLDEGFVVRQLDDPRQAIVRREAVLALSRDVWWTAGGRQAIHAESVLRRARGAPWWPAPPPLPDAAFGRQQGRLIALLILAIYTLYGVVFGAAMVARDRDQGTLEVELALPMPASLHGLSRWIAASAILSGWMVLGVALVAAWIGADDAPALVRIGLAAAFGAVALGLAAVGRAGLKTGFAVSLAGGLSAATALFGLGYGVPSVGRWLPIASLIAGGDGWSPLVGAAALGAVAVLVFTYRTARV